MLDDVERRTTSLIDNHLSPAHC